MTEQQFRLEVQNGIKQMLDGFMAANSITPSVMEDAINKYLVGLKDKVLQEFIAAASQPPIQEQVEQEEESGE